MFQQYLAFHNLASRG